MDSEVVPAGHVVAESVGAVPPAAAITACTCMSTVAMMRGPAEAIAACTD